MMQIRIVTKGDSIYKKVYAVQKKHWLFGWIVKYESHCLDNAQNYYEGLLTTVLREDCDYLTEIKKLRKK